MKVNNKFELESQFRDLGREIYNRDIQNSKLKTELVKIRNQQQKDRQAEFSIDDRLRTSDYNYPVTGTELSKCIENNQKVRARCF